MAKMPPPSARPKAKTVDDFKNLHDTSVIIPRKIKTALDKMRAEGRENWEYEGDFVRIVGVAASQLPAYRDQFQAHIVIAPSVSGKAARICWFADVKVAAQVRGE